MDTKAIALVSMLAALVALPLHGATLTVDGDASDWGFVVADNNLSTFVPAAGLNLIGIVVDDQDDNTGPEGFLDPHWGGQNYDAEAMAVALQGGAMYIVIVSGQRPDNGFIFYGQGELRIETSGGTYAVELGGGIGGGDGSAITTGASGSTYTLDGLGNTTAYADAHPLQTAGSVWKDPANWLLNTLPPLVETQFEIDLGGTFIGDADYIFTRDTVTTQHSIIEMSIPLSFFSGETIEQITYMPACGNDVLTLHTSFIPEPSTYALGGLAFVAFCIVARRARASRA